MTDRIEQARQALGVEPGADAQAIETAHAQKKALLESKRSQAPTDALRAKFDELLSQLDEAKSLLLAEAGGAPDAASSAGDTPASDGDGPRRVTPLSETKIADLPSARASATRIGDDTAGATIDLGAGAVLADRYEIVERIGAGGMGAVFRARDRNRDEDIAIKVLLPSLTRHEQARERFLDEARLSSKLSHPGIVNVYDVQHDGELHFITMELLEGQDLRHVMENRKLARQPFSEKDLKELGQAVCAALDYAHRHTVHRDIKPENIWLTEDGEYKLMDFGIARLQSASQRTQTSAVMGTAYYMAPEQLKGAKDIDGRADQYALGVMLYELATHEVPAGVIKPLREQRRDLSKGFCGAVMRALSADPEERHADMQAFAAALSSKSGGASVNLRPGRKSAIAAGLVGLAVLVGGAVAGGGLGGERIGAWLEEILPMSTEERRALQADAVRLQGQVNTLARRLENARRNLASELRDAEREESDDLAELEYWSEVTERNLFSGRLMSDLEGERAVAEALLRDKDYGPAIASFQKARDGYEAVLADFRAGEHLLRAGRAAFVARKSWDERLAEYELDVPEAAETAAEHEWAASENEDMGELASALKNWRDAERSWREALEATAERVAEIDAEREAARRRAAAEQAEAERRAAEERAAAARRAERAKEKAAAEGASTPGEARRFLARYPDSTYADDVRGRKYDLRVSKLVKEYQEGELSDSQEITYQYDSSGRRIRAETDFYRWTYHYDGAGNREIVREHKTFGCSEVTREEYDQHGNLTRELLTGCSGGFRNENKHRYNPHGDRVETETRTERGNPWSSESWDLSYDEQGNLSKRVGREVTETYEYDSEGRRTRTIVKDPRATFPDETTFEYDERGNLVLKKREYGQLILEDGTDLQTVQAVKQEEYTYTTRRLHFQ